MPLPGGRYERLNGGDAAEEAITIPESPKRGQREGPSPTSSATSGSNSIHGGSKKSPTRSILGIVTDIIDTRDPRLPARFIKLLGVPPPNSDNSITSEPIDIGDIDPRNHVMDVIDADNEDPFTLDSLESLLINHSRKGLDFILARVATVDPDDEHRFYYSYYAAHHINKVLFRTQPEEGLLHRMRAKNPLNNMTIVGDVHYYVISSSHAKERIKDLAKFIPPKTPLANIGTLINGAIFGSGDRNTASHSQAIESGTGVNSSNGSRPPRNHFRSKSGGTPSTPSESIEKFMSQVSDHNQGKRTIRLIARPEAFEPDSISSSGPDTSGPFATGPLSTTQTTSPAKNKDITNTTKNTNIIAASSGSAQGTAVRIRQGTLSRKDSRRNSFDDAFKDPVPSTLAVSTSRPVAGIVNESPTDTQLVLDIQRHRKVRSHAYSNEGTQSMNLHEWLRVQAINKSRSHQGSPEQAVLFQNASRVGPSRQGESPNKPTMPLPELFYEAFYYASDDDFLMKPGIRAFFRENALESADAVLFSISTSSDPQSQPNTTQHPTLANFLYSVDEDNVQNGARARARKLNIIKWTVFMHVIPAILIIKFLVPAQYTLVSIFMVSFLFCLVMIVLI